MRLPKSVSGRLRRAAAFTLVELLVVIGIIALLISILLPSLAKAREAAVTVQCMSQMRQIGQFVMMYANDNKGVFPMDGWGFSRIGSWQTRLVPYDGRKFTDADLDTSKVWAIFHRTGQNAKWLYCCPTQVGLHEANGFNAPDSPYWTSYLANLCTYTANWDWTSGVYLAGIPGTGSEYLMRGKQLSSIQDPANVIMVCEITYVEALCGTAYPDQGGWQGQSETENQGLAGQITGYYKVSTEYERPHGGSGAGVKAVACNTWWNGANSFNFRTRGTYNYLMVDGHVASLNPMETLAASRVPPTLDTQNGMWVDGKNREWHYGG